MRLILDANIFFCVSFSQDVAFYLRRVFWKTAVIFALFDGNTNFHV